MRKKLGKKGQVFDNIAGIMVGLVSVALVAIIVFLIVSQARVQVGTVESLDSNISTDLEECKKSAACNSTLTINESVESAVSFMPIIIIAAIGAVLLGLVSLFRSRRE